MCLPNPQKDAQRAQKKFNDEQIVIQQQQAAEAKAQQDKLNAEEAQRQTNINSGKSAIDNAFSQFGDDYYNGAQNDYRAAQLPDLDSQYKTSLGKLTAALKERGVLESTVGASSLADLLKKKNDTATQIGNNAVGFSNDLKSSVDSAKNNLYNLNSSAADPNLIAAQATGQATSLAQAPGGKLPGPLGDVFTNLLTPFIYAAAGKLNGGGGGYNATAPISGSGSSRIFA